MSRARVAKHLTAATTMAALLAGAGCGTDDEPPAVCSAVDTLETSVAKVRAVEIEEGALPELRDNLIEVQSDLRSVRDEAKDEYASEIDTVDQATASVDASLEAAIASPSAQAISDVGATVESLGASLTALKDAVTSTC